MKSFPFIVGVALATGITTLIMQKQAKLSEGEVAWSMALEGGPQPVRMEILKSPLDSSLLRSFLMPDDPDQAYICVFRVGERKATSFRFSSESFYPGKLSGNPLPKSTEGSFDRIKYPIQAAFHLGDQTVHGGTDSHSEAIWTVLWSNSGTQSKTPLAP